MPVKTKQRLQKEYRWHPPRAVITVQGSRAGSEQAPSAPSCARGGGCHRQPWGASTPGAHGLQELTSPGEPTVVCSSGGPSGSVCCYLLTWSCFSSAGMEEQRDVCGAEPCLQSPRRSIRGFLCQEHHQISSVGEQAGASHTFFIFIFSTCLSLCFPWVKAPAQQLAPCLWAQAHRSPSCSWLPAHRCPTTNNYY